MSKLDPSIRIHGDTTNPGQFFACCGLLELADRLWPGAEGWFGNAQFLIDCGGTLEELVAEICEAELEQLDLSDDMSSPLHLSLPFDFTLDWWTDSFSGGKQLKVWAGSMRGARIARAMQHAMADIADPLDLFGYAKVVYDSDQRTKKVEPFYFDSRRGSNARSLDIGFGPDSLKMTTMAFPAVEFLCLIGLQRFRPASTERRRTFEYYVWTWPLPPQIAMVACCGILSVPNSTAFRFENAFRTDQKKHKSFLQATRVGATA